jgi:tetratricopeptide (TPR) repeat protein
MTTKQNITVAYDNITGKLDKMELKTAFGLLHNFLDLDFSAELSEKLTELQNTYRQMLHYSLRKVKDPMQEDIYRDILIAAYELTDKIKFRLLSECESPSIYYTLRKKWTVINDISIKDLHLQASDLHGVEERSDYENTIQLIFNKTWLSATFTRDEHLDMLDLLKDDTLPYSAGCQAVSALILSLFTFFDLRKVLLLIAAAGSKHHEEIRTRALIGLLLILYMYRERTGLYPQIAHHLASLADTPDFTSRLRTITLKFILAKETENITRKLNDEILPAMMKYMPDINKINKGDINPENFAEENPEWHEMLTNGSLGKTIEEYNELQSEGADVMHSTFAYLKHFDFFSEMSNWFLPFSIDNSNFKELLEDSNRKGIMSIVDALVFLCNSDKYSFLLTIMKQLPADRLQMFSQLRENAMEAMEHFKDIIIDEKGKFDIIAGQYIQDLYRFFKLHHFRSDFSDIFLQKLDFYNLPLVKPYLSDPESLSIIAEYYLKKNHFDEAHQLFIRLRDITPHNDMLLQKVGFCSQMKGDIPAALNAYLQADIINSRSKWLIKRIAGCYRAGGQPDLALDYYRRLEEIDPENLSIQLSIGHCYLEQSNYAEALKYYFKVDYLDTDGNKALRPLAWCLFLTRKYEQAFEYYQKIMDETTPTAQDYINAGHTAWAMGKPWQAINRYQAAIIDKEDDDNAHRIDLSDFMEHFRKDEPYLLDAGIDQTEIPLLLDQLRYRIEDPDPYANYPYPGSNTPSRNT